KLIIEVRDGMTSQDSVEAVCSQSGDIQPLEPLTKVANPKQLVAILKGANKRAGSLGEIDHYVALAAIEVDKVEVNERTFMRLIAAGDQPLELKHLGQSLFVNDEALFAAATTAYTRVHVLKEDLQQMALNNLLSYLKPVGYVVHAEDETQAYPVPAGYPKLAVNEAPGEIIVFRGQKQNPSDIAFVQMGLYHLLEEFYGFPPATETITKIKTDKVKSYQYVIRNRQTALLEELAAQHNAGLNEDGLTTRSYEDILVTLAYYESFQQALTSATQDSATQDSATQDSATQGVADEFEFSIGHVRVASSVMTPTWMYNQLLKHFGFKPELKDLLSNRHFVQNIHELVPIVTKAYGVSPPEDGSFASKVIGDFAGQTFEMASKQDPEVRSRAIQQYLKRQIPGLDLSEQNEGITTEDHNALKARLYNTLLKNAALEEELKDIRTPGHPKAMPEVLRILRAAARVLGKKNRLNDKDDVYFQRQVIAILMHLCIREARRVSELKARIKLQVLEKILTIKINKGDDKATRLQRIRAKIDGGDVSYHELSGMYMILRPGPALEADLPEADIVLSDIHDRLNSVVEESDQRAEEQQLNYLTALEMELNISPHENPAAQERGKIFMAQLARALQLGFADDANLFDQQHVLRDRIQELMEEVNEFYDDEGAKRIKNNQIADQLNIKNYRYHGSIDEQNSLIEAKLEHLDEEVFKAGQPDVDERIAAIEHELDKQMARLGPKPRFDLHRDVARAKRAIKKAESNLSGVHRKLNNIRRKQVVYVSRTDVYPAITDEDEKTLNQAIKQIQIDYDLPA
ncbi:hypothetical protein, partial [Endozoicomonas sp. ONNA1]|uniref:hypothetical protein n=2 Tax=unclassified Endozoicomonas TaxID=2644528 RepID=UPI002148FEBD